MASSLFIVLLLTAVFVGGGIVKLIGARKVFAEGNIASATIADHVEKWVTQKQLYFPVVEFTTEKDEHIRQTLETAQGWKRKIGTKIEVIYHPDYPTRVKENSFFQLKFVPWAAIAIGIAIFVVGMTQLM